MRTHTLWAASFAAIALIATGCGALGTADEAAAEATSPLAEFFGVDTNGPGDEQFKEQERKANELTVACMTEQGFEYVPESQDSISIPSAYSDDELPYDSLGWAEKYGYGISTTFADQFSQGAAGEGYQDPNQEYLDGLSEGEVEAYYKALYGEDQYDPTEEPTEQGLNQEPSGCQNEAFEQAFAEDEFGRVYDEFGDELDSMYERMLADPRVVEANETWSTCIRKAGYEFSKQEETYEAVTAKMEPLWGSDPFESMTEEEIANLSEAESEELFSSPPDIDEQALAEVQEYEIALAVADWDCSEAMRGLQEGVMADYEREFIETNRDRLTELKTESS